MIVDAQVTIAGSADDVWNVITDIDKWDKFMNGIEKIEIIEKPSTGLVGLRWRETRMYFGKAASVEKRITNAVEKKFYQTRAEDSEFLFLTTVSVSEDSGSIRLTSSHDSQPQGLVSKLKSAPMFLFKGVIRKALIQDLNDIRSAVESKTPGGR